MKRDLWMYICAAAALASVWSGCGPSGERWTVSVPVMEREPRPAELLAYPADGQTALVNPPGFCWTPHESAKSYRLEGSKAGDRRTVICTAPQTSTVYAPVQKLEPGEYLWQVVYLDAGGNPTGVSKTRGFRLPVHSPELLMPDIAAFKARLAGVRPRLFLAGDRLKSLQAAVARGAVLPWKQLRETADGAVAELTYPEPAPYSQSRRSGEEWLRVYAAGKTASAHLARTALAYKITGEKKYLSAARRWLLALASWNPTGITSHALRQADGTRGNDEASMPMLERMSFAWDWIGDDLTSEERSKVLGAMTERGNQVLRKLVADDFITHPFINKSGRVIAFLGEAGLAFLGDIPDAEKWLDYVLRCYLTSYPGWGGDEGGWSEGLSYWSFYVYNHANFIEALREISDTDILRRPFYRNTGYLPVYFLPPYAPSGGFGDGAYYPPNESGGLLTDFFAEAFRDPVLKWQAREVAAHGEKNVTRWREWFLEDVVSTWRAAEKSAVQTQPSPDPDGSRHFSDIGWVAMHSALGDAENDVWALFKSSRYGSYSHSHADQNTFQLYAYGRALAIDSGYFPITNYGTPHENLWTRQTRAHNGILVNGRGQPPHTWAAAGRIELYERHGPVTLLRGEAAAAYNLPQTPGVTRQWQKSLKEPVPVLEPKLEKFERTLAFVASRTRPVLVVHDYLKTAAPTNFDWLLHTLNQMETDSRTGAIYVRDGNARLAVRLTATAPYRFLQHSGFPVKPEFASNTAYFLGRANFPDQWHLKAATGQPVEEIMFLAVLVPYRASESQPQITSIRSDSAIGFRIGETEVAAWRGRGATGKIQAGELAGYGRIVITFAENGKTTQVVSQ